MNIERTYFNKLWEEHKRPEISILLGARQVGKSTLMRQLENRAKREKLKTTFYDLEQPSDLNRLSGRARDVIDTLTKGADCVFIDEFHYLENASKIFKAIYDSKRPVKIYASGSSSLEIHKHLKESLAGRYRKHMIFPLTLDEWGRVKDFQDSDYLIWGGLPGLIHEPKESDRLQLLENILSAYITKDIKGLIKEENIRSFNSLLYCLAQSQGSVVVASNLARETGLSESTVARHLEIMSQTYVMHCVQSYSMNLANELKKSKKYYLYDIGIRNMILKDVRSTADREDKGVLYESAVFLHLLSQLQPNMELRFWRTKKGDEVDFVLIKNRVPMPIEVKSKLRKEIIPKGMIQFMRRYPQAVEGIIYNDNIQQNIVWEGRKIHFRKWQDASRF